MYDEDAVSGEFRELAALADKEYRERLPDGGDPDAVLARSCVYGYLYDRYFLASPKLLVDELRWLRAGDRPRPPEQTASEERFRAARDALLDGLIARFADDAPAP
jgi:hypothetical protein